jgi:hypothetical protein
MTAARVYKLMGLKPPSHIDFTAKLDTRARNPYHKCNHEVLADDKATEADEWYNRKVDVKYLPISSRERRRNELQLIISQWKEMEKV